MYLVHFVLWTVSQKARIPSTSSCLVFGFISRLMNSLSLCQRFSMGFKSGDSGGIFHQLIFLFARNVCACFDVCFGSLSCMNRWWSANTSLRNGTSVRSRMLVYSGAFIFPSKMQIPHRPRRLMPLHTGTFTGCLALQDIYDKTIIGASPTMQRILLLIVRKVT